MEAILAHTADYAIGVGDTMAWHHPGDFKMFKTITMGNSILMGAKTFIGIARNYTKPGAQVLPGRSIYVVGTPRSGDLSEEMREASGDVDLSNVAWVIDAPAEYIAASISPSGKLFVAGGASVYKKFIPLCSIIHQTIISGVQCGSDAVRLHPETADYLGDTSRFRLVIDSGSEVFNGIGANYRTLIV